MRKLRTGRAPGHTRLSVSKLSRYVGILLCVVVPIASPGQTFKTLVNFNGSNGSYPSSVVQGRDGKLWGTANEGGQLNCGTAFKVSRAGGLTLLLSFDCTEGKDPGGLTLSTDGNFYGRALLGGVNSQGAVFKLTPGGVLTVLLSFDGSNGASPVGDLTEGTDGNFYGATYSGGPLPFEYGTLFKTTPSGTITTLYNFDFTHGAQPYAGVVQGTDGNFYGTTYSGGRYGAGTVFKITRKGVLTVLHNLGEFAADGHFPVASLIQGTGGNFYGTTPDGGPANDGTVFKITPKGTFTTLYAFAQTDGRSPAGELVQATDGNFYGTTAYGGAHDQGTIFKMTASGTISTLHSFDGTHGGGPFKLIQSTNGKLYGLTSWGGKSGLGTIFSLDVALGPFVEALPTSGKVGNTVDILGQGFTGTTDVSFNGTPASFAVVKDTFLESTVPAGATTGFVTVTTPSGTLKSNKKFRVKP